MSPFYIRRSPPFIKGYFIVNAEPKRPGPETTEKPMGTQPARKPRADAQRNRERLLAVAKTAFADEGADVSRDEIARGAGVGIGTLYRHFPTRDAIVEAVYRREVEQLAGSASRLLGSLSPGEALREWMRLFVDYIATKKVIASALCSIARGATHLYHSSGPPTTGSVAPPLKPTLAILR